MLNLVRSEWIKFRSVRSTVVTLALAAALMLLVAVLSAANADENGSGQTIVHLSTLAGGVNIAVLLFGTLGVQVIGQEYRFNTIRPTFTAEPKRLRVMAAKLIVVNLAAVITAAVMLALVWVIGTVMVDELTIDGLDHRVVFGILLFSMGFTSLGVAIGSILRQPIAGILVLLIEAFLAEPIVGGLVKKSGKWLPFNNGFQMTYRGDNSSGGTQLQSVTAGGIYFFVVVAILVAIGLVLVQRRDA